MPLDVDNAKGELVLDPYRYKERYQAWDKKVEGLSAENQAVLVRYLEDIRQGVNTNPRSAKGKRGYQRLLTQRHRLTTVCRLLQRHAGMTNIAVADKNGLKKVERDAATVFAMMEDGRITKVDGSRYLSVRDYVKGFKAFWHWYMVYMRREKGVFLPDITEYLSIRDDRKPRFVFFGEVGAVDVEEAFRKLFDHAKYDYRALLAFMFDTGIRCPTELVNVKRKDITPIRGTPYFQLNIRDETSKTFGRRIKLMLCHEPLRSYLEERSFQPEDFVFPICPRVVNQYLKRLGERVLGKKGITMYDFRHNSVCYFLPRYKNENALMYRFGWKDSKMIHYYSEFLGMKDTLQEDDFLVDVTKTQLERELESEKRQRLQLHDELQQLRSQLASVNAFMNRLTEDEDALDFLARKAKKIGCVPERVTGQTDERQPPTSTAHPHPDPQ